MGVKRKRIPEDTNKDKSLDPPAAIVDSDALLNAKNEKKWTNKTRVLVFAARGVAFRERHLLGDLRSIMPHSKSESKKDRKDDLRIINEIAEMKNCSKVLYIETRKKKDIFMWMANAAQGPSVKFEVQNVHTMKELRMTGNCLQGTRPLLSFDKNFNEPHWLVMKELITQIFGTPNHHPKSQPFIDHVFSFSILDDKIWFRNFQIVEEDGKLTEIGPRFVLNPIKVFAGSFGGESLWSNPKYITPNVYRRMQKTVAGNKYRNKLDQESLRQKTEPKNPLRGDPTNEIFRTKPPEEAKGEEKQIFNRKIIKKKKKIN